MYWSDRIERALRHVGLRFSPTSPARSVSRQYEKELPRSPRNVLHKEAMDDLSSCGSLYAVWACECPSTWPDSKCRKWTYSRAPKLSSKEKHNKEKAENTYGFFIRSRKVQPLSNAFRTEKLPSTSAGAHEKWPPSTHRLQMWLHKKGWRI
jgi:hypothetical protein